jgi:hypothetical protein
LAFEAHTDRIGWRRLWLRLLLLRRGRLRRTRLARDGRRRHRGLGSSGLRHEPQAKEGDNEARAKAK